jgi:hypothetical protein
MNCVEDVGWTSAAETLLESCPSQRILPTHTTDFSQLGTAYNVKGTQEFYTKQMGLPLRTLSEWGSMRLVRP